MAKHYYYRCDSASEIGWELKRLLNDCQKAERTQMDFGRKCGAESIVPVDDNFEGGVIKTSRIYFYANSTMEK